MNIVFKVLSHSEQIQGDNHFPHLAGHTISHEELNAFGLPCHLGILLETGFTSPSVQPIQIFLQSLPSLILQNSRRKSIYETDSKASRPVTVTSGSGKVVEQIILSDIIQHIQDCQVSEAASMIL